MRHVGQEQPDPVALAIAHRLQSARDPVRAVERLGIAVRPPEEIDQRPRRRLGTRLIEQLDHRLRGEMRRSEEHTSELQSLMRISYAVFCLKKKKKKHNNQTEMK